MAANKGAIARRYTIKCELRVLLAKNTIVAEGDDNVAASVRHTLRTQMPSNWTASGIRFDPAFADVVAVERVE